MFTNSGDLFRAIGQSHSNPPDGEALHMGISPERWCVSRTDLSRLRTLIKNAVLKGDIIPTELDDFDPNDDEIGPCIHTVNLQFIKPMSALAGNCSWALMCNPEGGKCDVFVTHAWQEGIFEFIDKVLYSWPSGAQFAYCCMLSNPQNLDIAGMIASPSDSPFAKALRSASVVLVVPNRRVSIYTRIWCVYEAFLAYTWGKMIFTASAPVRNLRCRLVGVVPFGLLGCIGALFLQMRHYQLQYAGGSTDQPGSTVTNRQEQFYELRWIFSDLGGLFPLVFAIVSAFAGPSIGSRIVNSLGMLTVCLAVTTDWGDWGDKKIYNQKTIWQRLCAAAWDLIMIAFFVVAEADRMWASRFKIEANDLIRDYSGRLSDAQSSQEGDKLAILDEIGRSGQHLAVDEAVDVLIKAGMSSPSLQLAARLGVDVKFTCRCKVSVALFAWGHWLLGPLYFLAEEVPTTNWEICMTIAVWLECLVCLGMYFSFSLDRRTFTSLSVLKVFFVIYMFPYAIANLASPYAFFSILFSGDARMWSWESWADYTDSYCYKVAKMEGAIFLPFDALLVGPCTLLVTYLGPGRLASVPVIGRHLCQYILGSNLGARVKACFFRACCWCCLRRQARFESGPMNVEMQLLHC